MHQAVIFALLAVLLSGCVPALRNGNGLIGNRQSCPSYAVQKGNVIVFHDVKGDGC
jgi:hypothetical protein